MTGTPQTYNPPRQERSRESLERYLDAAESLIRTHTFHDLNVADVARLAGFSVGGLYSRFPNKVALLAAVRQRFLKRTESALGVEYEAGRGTDTCLEDAVRRMVHLLFRHFMSEREIFRAFIIETPNNPGFEREGQAASDRRKVMFTEALMEYAEEIQHPDPANAIAWVFTLTMALIRERLIYGEAAPITGGHSDLEVLARMTQTGYMYLSCDRAELTDLAAFAARE